MATIFLLYKDQALPVVCRENPRSKGFRVTCALGGELTLTMPPRTAKELVFRFLDTNRDIIGRQAMEARKRAEALPGVDEDQFCWLGREYPVLRKEGGRELARWKDDHVLLTLIPSQWSFDALDRLRRRMAAPLLEAMTLKRAEALNLLPVTFSARAMFTRFGSCQPGKRHITLSSYLTRMPQDVILSVIDHELCHLDHPGHDGAFYRALYRCCPEYDAHKKKLSKELSPYLLAVRLQQRNRETHPALRDFSATIL